MKTEITIDAVEYWWDEDKRTLAAGCGYLCGPTADYDELQMMSDDFAQCLQYMRMGEPIHSDIKMRKALFDMAKIHAVDARRWLCKMDVSEHAEIRSINLLVYYDVVKSRVIWHYLVSRFEFAHKEDEAIWTLTQ